MRSLKNIWPKLELQRLLPHRRVDTKLATILLTARLSTLYSLDKTSRDNPIRDPFHDIRNFFLKTTDFHLQKHKSTKTEMLWSGEPVGETCFEEYYEGVLAVIIGT